MADDRHEIETIPLTNRTLALGRLAAATQRLVAGHDTSAAADIRAALALVEDGLEPAELKAELDRIRAGVDPETVAIFDELVGAAT